METVRVAICDDEILLLPQLSSMIKGFFCTYNLEVSLDTFSTAAGLLEKVYGSQPYDVYFLDIDIPEQDGIMLAEKIHMRQPEAVFLFVSAREERVYDTFQVQPIAFFISLEKLDFRTKAMG